MHADEDGEPIDMKKWERITLDPAVMGGKACLRGLRVTVGTVVGLLAAGRSREEILDVIRTSRRETSKKPSPTRPGSWRNARLTRRCLLDLESANPADAPVRGLYYRGGPGLRAGADRRLGTRARHRADIRRAVDDRRGDPVL